MKPRKQIATARTPDGGALALVSHDGEYSITINGRELMGSRQHESELALARLGCAHLVGRAAPSVLVGGLGMGYTLRQALDMLGPEAHVVVSELLASVVTWNRDHVGAKNGCPLEDDRVEIRTGNVARLIARSESRFDAILLDVDNGPSAIADAGNRRLYAAEGIRACRRALRPGGCLAVWAADRSRQFEKVLTRCGFQSRFYRVPAYRGAKSLSRVIWVASEDKRSLPPLENLRSEA